MPLLRKRDRQRILDPRRYEHGTRSKYCAGCRCDDCRKANTMYARSIAAKAKAAALELVAETTTSPVVRVWDGRLKKFRRGCAGLDGQPCHRFLRSDSTGNHCRICRELLVTGRYPRAQVIAHVKKLQRQGVGYRMIADAAKISDSTMARILWKRKPYVNARIARAILRVDAGAAADGAQVSIDQAVRDVRWLREHGITKKEIAQRLNGGIALYLNEKITVSKAAGIARIRREVEVELKIAAERAVLCDECSLSHAKPDRIRRVARMLELDPRLRARDLVEAFPCIYGGEINGARYAQVFRDRRDAKKLLDAKTPAAAVRRVETAAAG